MSAGRAVLYGRFSKAEKNGKVVSLSSQLKDEGTRAKADGFKVVAEFADDGFSAYDNRVKRPGWEAMLEYVERNDVDRIYTRDSDRTTRQNTETAILLQFCIEHGVTLVEGGIVTAPDDDDAQDMRVMRGVFDKRYSGSISKKVRNARRIGAEAGRPHPGWRPFGYNDDRRTLHRVEGKAYKELFERVIAGEGVMAISADWAKRGIFNRNGEPFASTSMRALIQNPRAVGLRVHHGEVIGKGEWEPIVSQQVQARTIAALKSRRNRTPSTTSTLRKRRLLSSMMVCSECGATLRVWSGKDHGGPKRTTYMCDRSSGHCGAVSVSAERAEKEVAARLLVRLQDKKTLKAIAKLRNVRADVQELLDAVGFHEDELLSLARDVESGDLTLAEARIMRKGIKQRLDQARDALDASAAVPAVLLVSPVEALTDWENMTLDQQRVVLDAFVDEIVLKRAKVAGGPFDPKRIAVNWRF